MIEYKKEFYVYSLDGLKELAKTITPFLIKGNILTFTGNLGAGKTTFIKFLIDSLDKNSQILVTSPTFNLVHIYNLKDLEVWHFDLYRLKNISEVYELGIEDAFVNGISLIEWPQIIEPILDDIIKIQFSFSNQENKRLISISGKEKWISEL